MASWSQWKPLSDCKHRNWLQNENGFTRGHSPNYWHGQIVILSINLVSPGTKSKLEGLIWYAREGQVKTVSFWCKKLAFWEHTTTELKIWKRWPKTIVIDWMLKWTQGPVWTTESRCLTILLRISQSTLQNETLCQGKPRKQTMEGTLWSSIKLEGKPQTKTNPNELNVMNIFLLSIHHFA